MSSNNKLLKKLAKMGKGGKAIAKFLIAINIVFKDSIKYLKKTLWVVIICIVFAGVFVGVSIYGKSDFLKNRSISTNTLFTGVMPSEEVEAMDTEETEDALETNILSADDMNSEETEEVETETASEKYIVEPPLDEDVSSFDKTDWKLILVNKEHPIPEDYTFELATISGSMECDARILDPLNEMFEAAALDGVNLVVCSPYRENSRQEYLFARKMKGYLNSGYSYIEAFKESSAVVTVPGSSEHQIGLSLDIISDNYYKLDENFGGTDAGIWLMKNAYKYGFILRYPKGKDYITGIIYEPWHYRYVGVDAATVIYEKNITLEEFIESL